MTVTNRLNRATMDGNGVSTTLALDFPFHSVEDLVVIETILATGAETTKVLNTDYTVIGAQDDAGHYPTGGEIVFTVAPASTVRMTAYRDPPMLQEVVLIETGKIPVKAAIESPLDKLTMIDQRLSERIDRALRLSDGDSLEMGRLPVKGVRASRYLGFDGDGNPTMMQTPTAMVTSLAQLAESTVAALPAAGAAGSLRKVTTGVRGVWMDLGAQWAQITGGIANIREFGALGDGTTDDTIAIQAALDASDAVLIPAGVFRITAPLLIRRQRQCLFGLGKCSIIACTPTSGIFCALGVVESVADVTIRDFTLLGNASSEPAGPAPVRGIVTGVTTAGTAHSAVSWDARCTIENLYISGLTPGTTGFNLGIQLNKSNHSRVDNCTIDSVYGTSGSFGYGVVCHGEHITIANTRVLATISGQGRHAFYLTSSPSYVTVDNCYAEDFQSEPFTTNIGSGGVGLAFLNCIAKDCMKNSTGTHDAVFAFHGGSKGRISNCRMYGETSASDNFGVTVKDHDHAIVDNVYMENIALHAVYIENADFTRVTNLDVNVAGTLDPTQYGGVTVIQSHGVAVDSITVVGPGRFVARLDSSSPQPTGCRFSNLLSSGSFTYLVENEELNPDTNRVASLFLPIIPRASLPSGAATSDNLVAIDDNGSGDRNAMVYAKGQRFRIDGGSNV